jgi:tetratricopeptide (TPR) repeat protein
MRPFTPLRSVAAPGVALAALMLVPGPLGAAPRAQAPPAAPAASSPSFEALAARAAKAKEAGRLDEAIRLYRRALTTKPSWLEGRWALATLLYDKDRFREAGDQLEKLAEARPGDGQALSLLGLCRARLGEHQAALDTLMKARALGIPSTEVRSVVSFQTAVLLNRLGDPDGAFEVLRSFAIDADDRPAVIEAFGLITLRLPLLPGEVPEGKREMVLLAGRGGYHMARARRSSLGKMALEELVSRYPAEPNVHYALGMYLLLDEPATAVEEFRRELAVSPDHHVAMIQIALAELRRGRAEEALPIAEKAARLAPNVPAARLAHGRALLAVGRTDAGVREMEDAVRLAPANPRLRFALAQAYSRAGREPDAARERNEFLRLQKSSGGPTKEPGDDPGSPSPDSR